MSSMPSYLTRCYLDGDEEGIIEGFGTTFNEQLSLESWQWKFRYDGAEPTIAVSVSQAGEIVCQYAVMPLEVRAGGKIIKAGQPVDVFCLRRPGTARLQIYNRTYQWLESSFCGPGRRFQLLFGFPNARALRQGQVQMGYPIDPPRVPLLSRTVAGRFVSRLRRELRPNSSLVGHRCSPEEIDALWQRSCHRYPVSVARDGAWVRRRYLSRPGIHYPFLEVRRQGLMSVWAAFRACGPVLKWVDLVWDGHDEADLLQIAEMARRLAIQGGQKEIDLWLMGDGAVQSLLCDAGWTLDHEAPLWFAHRFYDEGVQCASTFSDLFYLTMGVSDHV